MGKKTEEKQRQTQEKNKGTTTYLPHGRQKNRLESPSTTVAPPSEGRKPSGTEIESSRDREKEEEQKQKKNIGNHKKQTRAPPPTFLVATTRTVLSHYRQQQHHH